jgi:predicted anti-sigma-YlaC factor YlaD
MRCEESVACLPAYLERDLPPEQAARLEEHMLSCAVCRDKLRQLEENRRLLYEDRERAIPAPPLLAEDVMARVHLEKRLRERRARLINQGFLIGVLACTNLLLAVLLLRSWRDRS